MFGIRFPNPVGLAAGMDKNGVALPAWPALGFGFVEVGTVTAHPQPGNDRPRLFRLPRREAIINRMGFNNAGRGGAGRPARGARAARCRSASARQVQGHPGGGGGRGLPELVPAAAPYADYIAVNVSSPNTPGLRALQDKAAIWTRCSARCGTTPLLVKIAPDLTETRSPSCSRSACARGGRDHRHQHDARPGRVAPGDRTWPARPVGCPAGR